MVGAYCPATKVCTATVALGATCVSAPSLTQRTSECGYNGYCWKSPTDAGPVCYTLYSVKNGVNIGATQVNQICASGYAGQDPNGADKASYFCQQAPKSVAAVT